MEWDLFVQMIRSNPKFPLSALFLQAVAEVTNFHIVVMTAHPDRQYILDISPTSKAAGVKEFGLLKLAHWSYIRWATLEDGPQQSMYGTPALETRVLNQMEAFLSVISKLSDFQLKDLRLSDSLLASLESWRRERREVGYTQSVRVLTFGYGGDAALGQDLRRTSYVFCFSFSFSFFILSFSLVLLYFYNIDIEILRCSSFDNNNPVARLQNQLSPKSPRHRETFIMFQ